MPAVFDENMRAEASAPPALFVLALLNCPQAGQSIAACALRLSDRVEAKRICLTLPEDERDAAGPGVDDCGEPDLGALAGAGVNVPANHQRWLDSNNGIQHSRAAETSTR